MRAIQRTIYPILQAVRHQSQLTRFDFLWRLGRISYRWLLRATPLGRIPIEKDIGGIGTFLVDPYFAFSELGRWGEKQNKLFRRWVQACAGKRCVIDVGGHVGWYCMPASQVLASNGNVVVFEPSSANLWYLKRHLAFNNIHNVSVCPYLVGEANQEQVPFFEMNVPTGVNSLASVKSDSVQVTRTMITLDQFCSEHKLAPEIIKVDIEGAELKMLRGAKNVLQAYRPLIFLSVHPRHLQCLGESVEELCDVIQSLNYTVYDIVGKEVNRLLSDEYLLQPNEREP